MSGIFGNFGTAETVSINCLNSLSSVKPVCAPQDPAVDDNPRHGIVKLRGTLENDSFDFNRGFDADDRPGGNKQSLLMEK